MNKKRVLLVIESSRAYGRGLIQGITRYVQERNHWSVTFEEQGILTSIPSWLREWQGDGIICRTGVTPLGLHLRQFDKPIVELLGDGVQFVSEIQSDAAVAGELAAGHFHSRGLPHFAYYSYGNAWWGVVRGNAFASALNRMGRKCEILISRRGKRSAAFPIWERSFEEPLHAWLRSLPKPIGIWCAADTVAQRVHAAASDLGFMIPDEIAILGIDNDSHLCNVLTPPLSSIEPNSVLIGYQAAKLLDEKMNSRSKNRTLKKPMKIPPLGVITRQSTDLIAANDPEMVRIARYIRNNVMQGLRVGDVVKEYELSKRTLERRYKQCFGRTIDHEIVSLRIEQAKKLLRETLLPVAEIGRRTCFDDNYFIKAFHRIVGLSPRAYRNEQQIGGRPAEPINE